MKKIIKITALILALICIGTSCSSCGGKLSNEGAADEIINSISIVRESIDYVNVNYQFTQTWYASDLFPKDRWTGEQKYAHSLDIFDVKLNIETRVFEIYLTFMGHKMDNIRNDGKTIITIKFPIEIVSTSYGTISEDRKSVIAEFEYKYDESKMIQGYLDPGIIVINY